MSTIKFEGERTPGHVFRNNLGESVDGPKILQGIPQKAAVRIEAVPGNVPVFIGRVSEAAYIDLDPGKYVYSVMRLTGGTLDERKLDDVCYRGEFYHEVTEETWKLIQHLRPQFSRTLQTSEGPRWRCLVHGCDFEGTNATANLLHEITQHLGIDREEFLANPTIVKTAGKRAADLTAQVAKGGRLRPTKATIFVEEPAPGDKA